MADLILPVGIPGSGKSTLINDSSRRLGTISDVAVPCEAPDVIVCPDDIRAELTGDATDQSRNGEVFTIAHQRTLEHLEAGRTVVFDATNVEARSRRTLLQIAAEADARPVAWLVTTPHEESRRRNAARTHPVPEHAMDRMVARFDQNCSPEQLETEGFVVWAVS